MHIPFQRRISLWREMSFVPLCPIRKRGDKMESVNDLNSGSSVHLHLIECAMPVLPIAHDQALTGAFFRTSRDGLECGVPIPGVRLVEGANFSEKKCRARGGCTTGSENRPRPRLLHEDLAEAERTYARHLSSLGSKDQQIRALVAEIGRLHHRLDDPHRCADA